EHLRAYQHGPDLGGEARQIIWGVSATGTFVGGQTVDRTIATARKILLESGCVYRWENTICFQSRERERVLLLASRDKAEPNAASILTNLFCVGVQSDKSATQALPPANLVNSLLADQTLWLQLPEIRHHARRPVFTSDFELCGPGWHPEHGILVHGPDIT